MVHQSAAMPLTSCQVAFTSASSRADRACLERAGRSQPANGRLRDAVGAGQLCLRGALREALHGLTALMGCERRRATSLLGLSRPHGAVITKRNRGPRPVRRGFGQLHGWLEVAEPSGWRLTDRRPTFQFAGGELGWYTLKRRRWHFAEINDPLADLSERDPYQPAATFPRPTRQCHHRAKRHQVTRAIIDR